MDLSIILSKPVSVSEYHFRQFRECTQYYGSATRFSLESPEPNKTITHPTKL